MEAQMDRLDILLRDIRKEMRGIEIGPYFAPLVPKSAGYRSLALDVLDKEQLLHNASNDENIETEAHARIEDVDLLGGATDIAALVEAKGLLGQIDYVVSSHNFEHLPNPILFLLGCEKVLTQDGFVSMAIPDRRGTFDYFRPVSTTAEFLRAFHDKSDRPTPSQLFAQTSLNATRLMDGKVIWSWDWQDGGESASSAHAIDGAYQSYIERLRDPDGPYADSHCSVFTRSSFELIIRDLHFLRIIDLGIERLEGPQGCEFYVKLKRGIPVPSEDAFRAKRDELLQAAVSEGADNTRKVADLQRKVAELEQALKNSEARLEAVEGSISWKATAPLRKLRRVR